MRAKLPYAKVLSVYNSKLHSGNKITVGDYSRKNNKSDFRACYYKLCLEFTNLTLQDIADTLKTGFDHSTVHTAVNKQFEELKFNGHLSFSAYLEAKESLEKNIRNIEDKKLSQRGKAIQDAYDTISKISGFSEMNMYEKKNIKKALLKISEKSIEDYNLKTMSSMIDLIKENEIKKIN